MAMISSGTSEFTSKSNKRPREDQLPSGLEARDSSRDKDENLAQGAESKSFLEANRQAYNRDARIQELLARYEKSTTECLHRVPEENRAAHAAGAVKFLEALRKGEHNDTPPDTILIYDENGFVASGMNPNVVIDSAVARGHAENNYFIIRFLSKPGRVRAATSQANALGRASAARYHLPIGSVALSPSSKTPAIALSGPAVIDTGGDGFGVGITVDEAKRLGLRRCDPTGKVQKLASCV
eukprot:TRINITY_DN1242_c0_g1_i1.p1 TRINITY_DN1242_c0_g1~~TRINITY_DN1242_c0_g1_i1.p1  ORF type:complete len:263 (-),score=26.92 TRINITY_DN1242_c0_g1_i1:277-996(-)